MTQRFPGRLRPWIFLTFSTTRVVGRQPYAPAVFTPAEIPGTHFQRLSRPQGTWFRRGEPRTKIPSDITGNRSRDRPTSSAMENMCTLVLLSSLPSLLLLIFINTDYGRLGDTPI